MIMSFCKSPVGHRSTNRNGPEKNHVVRVEYSSTFTLALESRGFIRLTLGVSVLLSNVNKCKHTDNLNVNASGHIRCCLKVFLVQVRQFNVIMTRFLAHAYIYALEYEYAFKVVRHIDMPKAAPKSPFVIFKN